MEKKEALKEWCIEQAVKLYPETNMPTEQIDNVIKAAKKLEEYVSGKTPLTDRAEV